MNRKIDDLRDGASLTAASASRIKLKSSRSAGVVIHLPELALATVLDETDSDQSSSLEDPQDAGLPHIALMSVDLAFPPLTIVIDDESGTDSVAL